MSTLHHFFFEVLQVPACALQAEGILPENQVRHLPEQCALIYIKTACTTYYQKSGIRTESRSQRC